MEATIISIAISIISALFIHQIWRLANRYWFRPKKLEKYLEKLGFKGNPYRFFYGDALDFEKMRVRTTSEPMHLSDDISQRVLPYHHYIINKYGNKSFIWVGSKPRLNITDPLLLKEILSRPDEFPRPRADRMAYMLVGGLFTHEGDKWAQHKKIMNPAFHTDKLKNMVPSIIGGCETMMEQWEKLVASEGSAEADIFPYIEELSCDIICRTLIGRTYEESRAIYRHRNKFVVHAVRIARLLFFPWWWHLPTEEVRTLKSLHKKLTLLTREVVTDREEKMKTGVSYNDLLSSMVECMRDGVVGFSLEDIVDESMMMQFVGSDSTSRPLIWLMFVLSRYPDWQARAREEILQVFGDRKPDIEGLSRLKIVTMIIYEAHRLYPSTTMFHRSTTKETKIGDTILPAWIQMTVPIILINHNTEIWGEDAKEFKPERFSQGVLSTKTPFLAFGGGPRKCIAQNMSMVIAKIVVATVLRRFSLELSPTYLHAPKHAFLLIPQHGMNVVLRKLE